MTEAELIVLARTWINHWRNLPMEEPIVQVEEFLARHTQKRYALAHSSGTSALLAAYFGLGIGYGDEVIVPALCCSNVATPLLLLGAAPVFCDIDPGTLCMNPGSVESCLTSRTRAISVVHLWGNVCDMDALLGLSQKYNVPLVEDCSQSPGATYKGKYVGSFGDLCIFSMQGAKALSGGEGGAVVTDSTEIYNRILLLGHHGRVQACLVDPDESVKTMGETTLGLKLRPNVLAMALALQRLQHLDQDNAQRRQVADCYDRIFFNIPGVMVARRYADTERGGGTVDYPLIYKNDQQGGAPLDVVAHQCLNLGLPVKIQRYPPLHKEPTFYLADKFFKRPPRPIPQMVSLPIVEQIAPRIISIPFDIEATEETIQQMADILIEAIAVD